MEEKLVLEFENFSKIGPAGDDDEERYCLYLRARVTISGKFDIFQDQNPHFYENFRNFFEKNIFQDHKPYRSFYQNIF